jgi:hypothetical protein
VAYVIISSENKVFMYLKEKKPLEWVHKLLIYKKVSL